MSFDPVRHALITGASRGIGHAICQRLAADGWRTIGLAREFDKGTAVDERVVIDLADLDALPARLAELAKRFRDVDALILNAGRGQFGSLEEFSYEHIASLIALNFTAQAFVTRAFLPVLKRRGGGDIVFIGSEAALSGGRRGAVYSASKAALRGFAQALRDECAKAGVRVCVINPGAVRSDFFDQLSFAPGDDPANAILPEEVAAAVSQVLGFRADVVIDELNLSPLKRVWRFNKNAT